MNAPPTPKTALLLIDLQLGLTHPTAHNPPRSTPNLEQNITTLLSTTRAHNTNHPNTPIPIIHVHHHSTNPQSLLHASHVITWTTELNVHGRRGVEAMPCAAPQAGESVLTKSTNSAFLGTGLEAMLRGARVERLMVAGLTTEHCVSSSVRMAADLGVCVGGGGVVVVEDACACFAKVDGRGAVVFDADTVHRVEVECLRGEFAEVWRTVDVVSWIEGLGGAE